MAQLVGSQRCLAAILVADMVGYSRLMEAFEEYTFSWQRRLRLEILDPGIVAFAGRLVKNTGDGFVAVFERAEDATRCALALQQGIVEATVEQPLERRIAFRMAVNLAEIFVEEDDVYGDGVNVAARLQVYAEPGGVIVSGVVAEQVASSLGVGLTDLGELPLRNRVHPVRVYALRAPSPPACRTDGRTDDGRTDDDRTDDAEVGREPRPSLAVLPFRMDPAGPEERYFADGVVDDIIHGLVSLKELFVISRGATPGRGVRYLLSGRVERAGGRLRISTELSDAQTGTLIRSDQYDGSLSELFELHSRIAINVVRAIAPHVEERELVQTMRTQPRSLMAYDLVLQGLDHLYRMNHASFVKAHGVLQQAMAHDPGYAPACSYAALWYIFRAGELGSDDPEADAGPAADHGRPDPGRSALAKRYRPAHAVLDRATVEGPRGNLAGPLARGGADPVLARSGGRAGASRVRLSTTGAGTRTRAMSTAMTGGTARSMAVVTC